MLVSRYFNRTNLLRIPELTPILGIAGRADNLILLDFSTIVIKPFSTQDVFSSNVTIGALSRAGNLQAARQLFDKMPTKDVVSWNAIITGYWQNGILQESKKLFESMPVKNTVSWNSMIAGCIENDKIDEAFDYFNSMPERNSSSYNAMLSGFVKHARFDEARRLFEVMPKRNVISYTTMMGGYLKQEEFDKARALFDQMPQRNAVSWAVMINGYAENERFDEAKELFERMPGKHISVIVVTTMITGYCKKGMVAKARVLFDGIRHKDLVSYNAMINGYAQNGFCEEALKLYVSMLKIGMRPDQATVISVFTACSNLASLTEGKQTHVLVIRNGFITNVSVCNALVAMYSRCGCIFEAELAFREIKGLDIVSWNTIITAYAQHGIYEKAVSLFQLMKLKNFEPDGITFLSLLSACNHVGKVNESLSFFDLMVENYGITPSSEHYACLIDTLSRTGQLENALQIITNLPFEANSRIWGAQVAACVVHSNVKLAELAAKKIGDLDPSNSGAYVALSNIYASAGMWRDVMRVRFLMKELGVKKELAFSWMEIDNKVQCFMRGDISHLDTDKIYLELKRISLQLKSMDDIAEITSSYSFFD